MLVRDKQTDNPRVITTASRCHEKISFLAERAEIFLHNGCTKKGLFSVDTARFGMDITQRQEFKEADIIHLHWINQGMLSLKDMAKIFRSGKKIVWTMHDMWPFTGVCHQSGACTGWQEGCGNCPLLQRPGNRDISARTFARKAKVYAGAPLTLVGCSRWLAGLARQSSLLGTKKIVDIPNAIDTVFFCPGDKEKARISLGIPQDRKVLLFTAYKVTDPNKGIDYLRKALAILKNRNPRLAEQIVLVAVGREAEALTGTIPVDLMPCGYVSSPETMRDYYRAADVLMMPTLMDNLPNTIVEAMACGTPCVAHEIGGIPQMIDSGKDGFLVRFKDTEDLALRMEETLSSPRYAEMSAAARRKAAETYAEDRVAEQYIRLYEDYTDA